MLPLPLLHRGVSLIHAGNHHGGKAYTSRVAARTEDRLFPLWTLLGVTASLAPAGIMLRRSNQRRKTSAVCKRRTNHGVTRAVAVDEPGELEFDVTPWAGLAKPRPIYAVSDNTGGLAKLLVKAAWCQFGFVEEAQLEICPDVRAASDVDAVVKEVKAACGDSGAFIIFSLASSELCSRMTAACAKENISYIDALQPLLVTMEETLGRSRLGSESVAADSTPAAANLVEPAQPPVSVYAVSDSTGSCALEIARRGVSQFPGAGIKEVILCPEVRSVEEIRLIAQAAGKENGLIVFTFASTGMSRFMRQRCEMEGVPYADLYQPILLALELYLDYPSIGVPGGYDGSDAIAAMQQKWIRKPVT